MKLGRCIAFAALLLACIPPVRAQEVRLEPILPATYFYPGAPFWLDLEIENFGPTLPQAELYVLLDLRTGSYWCHPSWSEYPPALDRDPVFLPEGYHAAHPILAGFLWPDGLEPFEGARFWAAVTVGGDLASDVVWIEFGWGEPLPTPTVTPLPPTRTPTLTPTPTESPTFSPTRSPTLSPTTTPTPTRSPTRSPTLTPTYTPTRIPTSTPTITPTASPSPTVTNVPLLSEIVIGTEASTWNNLLFWRLYPDGDFTFNYLEVHVDGSVERIRIGNFMWNDPVYGDGNSTPESNLAGWWDAMVMTDGVDEFGNPAPCFSLWRNNSYDGAVAPASNMYEQVLEEPVTYPPLPYWLDPAVDPIIDFDVADLDGDGDLEMVAAAGTTIMLYDLLWEPVLGQMEIVELSCSSWAFEYDPSPWAPDINKVGFVQADGDGTWDLAICILAPFTGGEKIHVFTNDTGDGCFHTSNLYWSSFTEMRKQVNEVRGGWLYQEPGTVQQDLAMGDAAATLVLAENILTTYTEHNFDAPSTTTDLELFDLYGSSHEELIVLTGSEDLPNLYFYRNDPLQPIDPVQSWPGEQLIYPSSGVSLSAVAAGYLNYDETGPQPNGWPDLLLGARNGYVYVELHEGSGTPPFSTPYEYRQNVGAPVTQVRITHASTGVPTP